jgi:phage anti-repressor protein
MEKFIKQFSTIPHSFITDFFIIAKEEYLDNEIIINLVIVAKWLDVRKDDIKKILVNNFDEGFDYTIEKKKKKQINNRGATIYEEILITPNCMKEICMISQTKKAKEVRKYFIEMDRKAKLSILNSKSLEKN